MPPKLWSMNADFELELAASEGPYRRSPKFSVFNRTLAEHFLFLAAPGDALLVEKPWAESFRQRAAQAGVALLTLGALPVAGDFLFTPWGWTPGSIALGIRSGATVEPVPIEVVRRVNSKLFSLGLEREWGLALPGTEVVANLAELNSALRNHFAPPEKKWVIKHPLGMAANYRILGRGPELKSGYATWVERQFAKGAALILQPWLEVIHEYGLVAWVEKTGVTKVLGCTNPKTNLAGTVFGHEIGRPADPGHFREMAAVARKIGERLHREGYWGPFGIDALVHTGGFHPLLEINARYTMGFFVLEIEKRLNPNEPTVISLLSSAFKL